MTIDDDSLLSAYMDGQLGPEQQLAVESALVSDPRRGEELRSLTLVRDLLAGLPRDASVDVASRVMSRISGRSRLGMILSIVPGYGAIRRHPSKVAGLLAIAAGLLIAAVMSFVFRVGPGGPRGRADAQLAKHVPSPMLQGSSVDSRPTPPNPVGPYSFLIRFARGRRARPRPRTVSRGIRIEPHPRRASSSMSASIWIIRIFARSSSSPT